MNGYTIMSDSYKKLMEQGKIDKKSAEKTIRIYDFLATCDQDDIFQMVDSTAFNSIIKAYLKITVNNAKIDKKAKETVLNELRWIFDEKTAEEVFNTVYEKTDILMREE